ncbi:hypothetical protein AB0883_09175 [Micromonospora sp. NPDC047812]|uniref:hypothetical protein n=1 Tax=Micromonospora sp. NPDC047812 TaxID=3155742 RepID=UPI003454C21E
MAGVVGVVVRCGRRGGAVAGVAWCGGAVAGVAGVVAGVVARMSMQSGGNGKPLGAIFRTWCAAATDVRQRCCRHLSAPAMPLDAKRHAAGSLTLRRAADDATATPSP